MVQLRASSLMAIKGRHQEQPQMPIWTAPLRQAHRDDRNGHIYAYIGVHMKEIHKGQNR